LNSLLSSLFPLNIKEEKRERENSFPFHNSTKLSFLEGTRKLQFQTVKALKKSGFSSLDLLKKILFLLEKEEEREIEIPEDLEKSFKREIEELMKKCVERVESEEVEELMRQSVFAHRKLAELLGESNEIETETMKEREAADLISDEEEDLEEEI